MAIASGRALIFAIAIVAMRPEAAYAETLWDALVSTYLSNPELLSQRASLRALDEDVPQALAGWRPTVSFSGSAGVNRSDSSITSESTLKPLSGELTVTQPLYAGGATVSGTRSAEASVEAARATLRSVEQDVLLEAVTAYMDVLRDSVRVQLTGNNVLVLERQLEASRDRFEVGEVTRTDVAQSVARLSGAIADREAAEGDLATARATYERIVGYAPGSLEPAPPLPDLPPTLEDALDISIKENPDIVSARFTATAARHDVRTSIADLLPTLDLVGDITRTDESSTKDVTTSSDSITAQVTVPLYQAGSEASEVRQAKQTRSQRQVEVETAHREVLEATRQAWETWRSATAQITALIEEVRANEIALEGVRQEAAVGSRTTLDVLDAEQELLDARVNLVVAERDEYVAGFSLISAVGRLSAQRLELPVDVYDPEENYNRVRNRWWGLGTSDDE